MSNQLTSSAAKRRASAQRFSERSRNKEVVRRRWENELHNKCEGCGMGCDTVEIHHLFSSAGHVIADSLASRPELMVALCSAKTWGYRNGCHENLHQGLAEDMKDELRWVALTRLCQAEKIPISVLRGRDPGGAARACEEWMAEREC